MHIINFKKNDFVEFLKLGKENVLIYGILDA